jgi:lipopolysaccharide export system permease protein
MRLARYVLGEHIGPFFFGLIVITFVLIVDFIPQVLDLVVGRDIPGGIVFRLFSYNLAWMLALSVPMAVLVATLMAFGRLSADNEIVALKASGVNLIRVVAPVIAAGILMGMLLVWFNNDILPEANHSARVLMGNINRTRPTLQIRENIFVGDIPGYHLLVKKRDPRGNTIRGVTIYDQTDARWPRTVVADSGVMSFTPDGQTLVMELKDGEVHEFSGPVRDYRRTKFVRQTVYLPGAGGNIPESQTEYRTDREKSTAMMMQDIRLWKQNLTAYGRELDSASRATLELASGSDSQVRAANLKDAEATVNRLRGQIESQNRLINSMMIEVHKKYSIPVACVVFVLIGAPLGVMARRGGIGIGMGLSLGLFILYWAFLIGGEELADRLIVNAFWAMWSANFLIGAVGLGLLGGVIHERRPLDWLQRFRHRRIMESKPCVSSTAT